MRLCAQALLCDELENAKKERENAKKAVKAAAKAEKNCLKRRSRLLKAPAGRDDMGCEMFDTGGACHQAQAAKGLSAEDLHVLLAAKEKDATTSKGAEASDSKGKTEKSKASGKVDKVLTVKSSEKARRVVPQSGQQTVEERATWPQRADE